METRFTGMDALHRYVELTAQKQALDKEVDDLKEQIAVVKESVLEYMTDEAIQNIRLGDHLLYLRRDINATFTETPEAIALVTDHGFADAIKTTIHPRTASSIVREQIKDLAPDEKVPDWIKAAFTYYDGMTPAIRKS